MLECFLYKIDEGTYGTSGERNAILIVSSYTDESILRGEMQKHDNGGMPFKDFERVWQTGAIEKVTSTDQLSEEMLDWIPFFTDEIQDLDAGVLDLLEQMSDGVLMIPAWDD